jgi:3-hydroxyisobutyrate dehydrogenase-like beta-hydroxyacid dehydrogenase
MIDRKSDAQHIAFIGLGAMGGAMAVHLVRQGFTVIGYDISEPAMHRLQQAGGRVAANPAAAAKGATVLIVMVATAEQAEDALFGPVGAWTTLTSRATVMLCSTVPPAFVQNVAQRLQGKDIDLLDAPVSGGVSRAASGDLTTMASGPAAAFTACDKVLAALSSKVYRLGETPGTGSSVKMINQLLAGVHIAAAAEAMALATRAGLDPQLVFEVISHSAGASWMFTNRVPHILAGDYTPHSALDIFVKDLGIVLETGKALRFPLPLAASAHQMFLMGAAAGLGREDDAAVVKVYEKLAGIQVSGRGATKPSET